MRIFSYLLAALPLALAAPIVDLGADAEKISNKWIVVLKKDADDSLLQSTISSLGGLLGGGAEPDAVFNFGGFRGFSLSGSQGLINALSNLAAIDYIEPDSVVRTQALVTQQNPPYGLARISHRDAGQNTYVYDSSAGQGTFSYGIDTGIYTGHNDFGGRAIFGANFVDNNNTDGNGHGTHTAGTVGSTTYGVAKKTTLIAVKVLGADGSGASSGVIQGIQFAAKDMKSRNAVGKAVGNMSLGGPRTSGATNAAVAAAVKEGLFMAVAAGNSMAPAALFEPASEPTACTVGATDKNDKFASFSNFGGLVDILAPGVDVESTWIDGPNDTNVISGTSMSTPHIAGLGAYLLALEGSRSPAALCKRIQDLSTKGKVSGLTFLLTKNYLAYNGASG